MGIYVQNTFDYSANASVKSDFAAIQNPILAKYTAYITDVWQHTPTMPDPPGFPPVGGTYTSKRTWTDLTQAQTYVAELQTAINANPGVTAYSVGPMTAGQD